MFGKKGFHVLLICMSVLIISVCLLFSSAWANGDEGFGDGYEIRNIGIVPMSGIIGGGIGSIMRGNMGEEMDDYYGYGYGYGYNYDYDFDFDYDDDYFEELMEDRFSLFGLSALGAGYRAPVTYGSGYSYTPIGYPTASVIPSGWGTGYTSVSPTIYPATTYRPTYSTYPTTAGTYGWTTPVTAYTPSTAWTIPTQATYPGLTSTWSGLTGFPAYGYTQGVTYPSSAVYPYGSYSTRWY